MRRLLVPDTMDGRGTLVANWVGTGVFTVTAVAATVAPDTFRLTGVIAALALFAIGMIVMLITFAAAVERSRLEVVSVAGVWFGAGTVALPIRLRFAAALGIQLTVAFTTASIRPFTSLAFGILAPLFGLGLGGLWAAGHGSFAKRDKLDHKRPPRPPPAPPAVPGD
ncbi:MAG: hypothetical protein RIE08_00190 [Acidimicrobiales bacterium]